jgi:hypothetical protein
MSTLGKLVVVNELGIRPFRPASRGWIEFVRKTLTATGTPTPLTLKNDVPQFSQ